MSKKLYYDWKVLIDELAKTQEDSLFVIDTVETAMKDYLRALHYFIMHSKTSSHLKGVMFSENVLEKQRLLYTISTFVAYASSQRFQVYFMPHCESIRQIVNHYFIDTLSDEAAKQEVFNRYNDPKELIQDAMHHVFNVEKRIIPQQCNGLSFEYAEEYKVAADWHGKTVSTRMPSTLFIVTYFIYAYFAKQGIATSEEIEDALLLANNEKEAFANLFIFVDNPHAKKDLFWERCKVVV